MVAIATSTSIMLTVHLSFCLTVLRRAFDAFAQDKGYIETNMVGTILQMLGHDLSETMLLDIVKEVDADGEYIFLSQCFLFLRSPFRLWPHNTHVFYINFLTSIIKLLLFCSCDTRLSWHEPVSTSLLLLLLKTCKGICWNIFCVTFSE